jgi:hypothetical protein
MGSVRKYFKDKHRTLQGSKRDMGLVRPLYINLGERTFTAGPLENTGTIVSLLQVCIAVYAWAWSDE